MVNMDGLQQGTAALPVPPDSLTVHLELERLRAVLEAAGIESIVGPPLEPLGISDHHRRPGVLEPVDELLAGPPAVERCSDGSEGDGREEGDDPLRAVGGEDGDSVTGTDAAASPPSTVAWTPTWCSVAGSTS